MMRHAAASHPPAFGPSRFSHLPAATSGVGHVENLTYRVTLVAHFTDPNQVGEVDYSAHVIRLRAGLRLEDEAENLMHELLHAMLKDEGTREEMTGHDFIYLVAPKLISTLYAENPQLSKYMDRAARSR
jgi:hypothetical protein